MLVLLDLGLREGQEVRICFCEGGGGENLMLGWLEFCGVLGLESSRMPRMRGFGFVAAGALSCSFIRVYNAFGTFGSQGGPAGRSSTGISDVGIWKTRLQGWK